MTESTQIDSSLISSAPQEPTSTVLAEPTDASISNDTSPVLTQTQSTAIAEEEEETATAGPSSTDISSQVYSLSSSLSLTLSTTSTTQSVSLFPTSSSTDSTVPAIPTDISSSFESSLEPSSSIVLSTDSTATEPDTEETTTSISTTALPEETESSTQLGSTTTAEETTATETTTTIEDTTATETTTAAEDTTATGTTTTAEDTTVTEDTTTTAEETTTTAEETTTTGCDKVAVLTTVALLNPTPVFDDDIDHDDDVAMITLPFDVARSGQRNVFISPNGVVSVTSTFDVSSGNPNNERLPTEGLPPIAICPYWDQLYLSRERGDTIVYEVFDGQRGTQATFEWLVTSSESSGFNHFSATLYKDYPGIFRFSYYTTDDKGAGATTGAQDIFARNSLTFSNNLAGGVVDGSSVFVNPSERFIAFREFDNTECGKGDPPDNSPSFQEEQ